MKTTIVNRVLSVGVAAALALSFAGTAAAQQTLGAVHVRAAAVTPINLLAQASGLTQRQVQMVLGDRTAFAGYLANYERVDRKFQRAIGPEMYQRLKSDGELSPQDMQNLSAMVNAPQAEHLASK